MLFFFFGDAKLKTMVRNILATFDFWLAGNFAISIWGCGLSFTFDILKNFWRELDFKLPVILNTLFWSCRLDLGSES